MRNVISVYKPVGMTPLECIHLLQTHYPEYQQQKIAYAGRLDPMAEGLLLFLMGEECKRREKYQLLPKTYVCRMLLGFTSDTYDVLGKIMLTNSLPRLSNETIQKDIKSFVGTFEQIYPPYSSVRINGKPLFYWARQNLLSEISIPHKPVTIYELSIHQIQTYPAKKVINHTIKNIQKVQGDFRQTEAIQNWRELENKQLKLTIVDLEISCSSGTYIRSLVHSIGEKLKVGALVFALRRTTVGPYQLHDALVLSPVV